MNDSHGSTEVDRSSPGPKNESGWDDWWTSDRLDAAGWGVALMWGAVVVLATNSDFSDDFAWWDGWGVFFLGVGVITLLEATARLFMAKYRSKLAWTFVWGVVFLSIGLSTLFSSAWLALALVAVAIVILAGALRATN